MKCSLLYLSCNASSQSLDFQPLFPGVIHPFRVDAVVKAFITAVRDCDIFSVDRSVGEFGYAHIPVVDDPCPLTRDRYILFSGSRLCPGSPLCH